MIRIATTAMAALGTRGPWMRLENRRFILAVSRSSIALAYKYALAGSKTLLLNRKWAENAANGNKNRTGGPEMRVWNLRFDIYRKLIVQHSARNGLVVDDQRPKRVLTTELSSRSEDRTSGFL